MNASAIEPDLTVQIGNLHLRNPLLVASGTFGYAREMESLVDFAKLGGIIPKTVTKLPRQGNPPWRTVETSSGLLNSIGLDNDGIDYFLERHWPYLKGLPAPVIVSIAGKSADEFVELADRLHEAEGLKAIELNISCPNVSGGVDFGTDPLLCQEVVASVRRVTQVTLITKLTPNVTRIAEIAQAAEAGGADAVSCINTVLGMAIDWKQRKPMLGNIVGGLSGPAIKPIALRCVYQVAATVAIPVIGIGGIACLDDVMEFLIAGASAVQLGTVNYYHPTAITQILDELPRALRSLGAARIEEIRGSLRR